MEHEQREDQSGRKPRARAPRANLGNILLQFERLSPAARFFASEYQQMRLAGYEEDGGHDGGNGLLLKPVSASNRTTKMVSSGTPRTFVSPRQLRHDELGNSELVLCTVDQLKELVGDRRGDQPSWDILHRPQVKRQVAV